jgi:hypothetical protein
VVGDGLKEGEQVAIDGMMKIEDGGDVEVAAAPSAKAPADAPDKK